MTDLALGLPAAHAARLRALSAAAEAAHASSARAEAEYTAALADLEVFAQEVTADIRASREADMVRRTVASEFAVAVRESDRAVQARMSDAHTLVTGYPTVFALWREGRVSRAHVSAVTRAGEHLPADARVEFDRHAADVCATRSTTRAREALASAAERFHPRSLTDRHRDARRTRRVDVLTLGDGMSRLTADLPTVLAEGIHDRLQRMATAWADERAAARTRIRITDADRTSAGPGTTGPAGVAGGAGIDASAPEGDIALAADDRTVAQVRADTLADLLLTGAPELDPTDHGDGHGTFGALRAHVQVVIAATTLLGANEHSADLAGVGPVDAATARELAGNSPGIDRILTHPVSGQVLACDRYPVHPLLRRRLRARDRHCRFPGCRVPAIRCEADHTVEWARGGPTCLTNLALLCQRHHTMKQYTPGTSASSVTASWNGPPRRGGSTSTTPHPRSSASSPTAGPHPPSEHAHRVSSSSPRSVAQRPRTPSDPGR